MAKICIDAGHYGKYNQCPNNSNYFESKAMWKLHLLQKKYFEKVGIDVIVTRIDENKDLEVTARGRLANGCDLFISNHTNATGSTMNENIDYVAVYHLLSDNRVDCDDISKEVAEKLAPVITDVMNTRQGYRIYTKASTKDRDGDGKINDNYYGVLHGARTVNVPALILEHSFHTNSKSVEWLLDDNNLDKLARAEVECIASYLLNKSIKIEDFEYVMSREEAENYIGIDCVEFLHRLATEEDMNKYVEPLMTGRMLFADVDELFMACDEYNSPYTSDWYKRNVIIQCYDLILGRFPESEEAIQHWMSYSRLRDIYHDIYNSEEAINRRKS